MNLLSVLNNIFFKMTWLSGIFAWLLNLVGVPLETRLGGSIHFFFYDTVKILLLLSVLIYGVSYVQSYFPPEKAKKILGHFTGIKGNFMGSLLGVLTPF